jgi:hydrogenase nickel incorporation protein HypA/HybF
MEWIELFMHELPVTESILEIATRHASKENASRITELYLVIGQLSSIIDDSIQFYWDILSKDTMAEGAKLNFRRIPTEMLCLDCKKSYKPDSRDLACPACGSTRVKIVAGEEFYVEAISIEK